MAGAEGDPFPGRGTPLVADGGLRTSSRTFLTGGRQARVHQCSFPLSPALGQTATSSAQTSPPSLTGIPLNTVLARLILFWYVFFFES